MNELKDWPGQSTELLKALNILTRDGRLNQDSRRKLKQVQHLVQLITPHLKDGDNIVDLGAGKSYLGFMLYDLWMRTNLNSKLLAVELRAELIENCKKIAQSSGFDRIQFVESSIAEASNSINRESLSANVVTALHACDTATDDAIDFALAREARVIALVPCCQAEMARVLESVTGIDTLSALWRHGIHRREFGAHLTNVLRALFLEAQGYKVRVTELIGWEHSMKNELILAVRHQRSNPVARRQLDALLDIFEGNGSSTYLSRFRSPS